MIFQKSGLAIALKADNTIEGMGRLENVNSLLDGIKEFVENDEELLDEDGEVILERGTSMADYLQSISLITDFDQKEDSNDHVNLMSVHSAKGPEFDSVFVVGLEEQLFPSFLSLKSEAEIDEERRLFYVAITRSKDVDPYICHQPLFNMARSYIIVRAASWMKLVRRISAVHCTKLKT